MQHDDVVAGFHDGKVELRVQGSFGARIPFAVRGFHLRKDFRHDFKVCVRAMTAGTFSGQTFHVPTERDVVEDSLFMVAH